MGILTNSIHTIVRGDQVITTGAGDMWVSGLEYSGDKITGYSGSAFNGCECDTSAIVDSAYDITTAWVTEQGYLTAHQDLTGLPYVQNSALENTTIFDTDLISGISGTGLFAQSANGAFNADHANTADHANSASIAESALSAGTASNSNSAVSSLYAMNVVSGWEYNENNKITAYNGSAIDIPIEYSAGTNIDINDHTISVSDVVAIKSHEGEPNSGSIAFGNIVHWGQQDYAPGWAIEAYTDSGREYHSYNTCDIGLQAFYWGEYDHDRATESVSGESHLLIYEGDIKYQSGTFQKVNTLPVIWSITGIKADTDDVRDTVSTNSATWGGGVVIKNSGELFGSEFNRAYSALTAHNGITLVDTTANDGSPTDFNNVYYQSQYFPSYSGISYVTTPQPTFGGAKVRYIDYTTTGVQDSGTKLLLGGETLSHVTMTFNDTANFNLPWVGMSFWGQKENVKSITFVMPYNYSFESGKIELKNNHGNSYYLTAESGCWYTVSRVYNDASDMTKFSWQLLDSGYSQPL